MQIKRWLSFCLGLNVMLAIQTQLQPQPRSQSVQSRVWVSMIHLSAIGMSLEGVAACFFVGCILRIPGLTASKSAICAGVTDGSAAKLPAKTHSPIDYPNYGVFPKEIIRQRSASDVYLSERDERGAGAL